jgi:hypothetical protein
VSKWRHGVLLSLVAKVIHGSLWLERLEEAGVQRLFQCQHSIWHGIAVRESELILQKVTSRWTEMDEGCIERSVSGTCWCDGYHDCPIPHRIAVEGGLEGAQTQLNSFPTDVRGHGWCDFPQDRSLIRREGVPRGEALQTLQYDTSPWHNASRNSVIHRMCRLQPVMPARPDTVDWFHSTQPQTPPFSIASSCSAEKHFLPSIVTLDALPVPRAYRRIMPSAG